MTIRELRDWLNNIPPELEEYDIVFRTFKELSGEYWAAFDRPITYGSLDDDNYELYFCDEENSKTAEEKYGD